MADTAAHLLIMGDQPDLPTFVKQALDRAGISVIEIAPDKEFARLIVTVPIHEAILGAFLNDLDDIGRLRVVIHADGLAKDYRAVLGQLADFPAMHAPPNMVSVLLSEQFVKAIGEVPQNFRAAWFGGMVAWRRVTDVAEKSEAILSLALTPDGQLAATGHADGRIRTWHIASGRPAGPPLTGHDSPVTAVAITPDGQQVASGDVDGIIWQWPLAANKPAEHHTIGRGTPVQAMAATADSQLIISGHGDGQLRTWDVRTTTLVDNKFGIEPGAVTAVVTTPDGREVICANALGEVARRDRATGKVIGRWGSDHADSALALALTADGADLWVGGTRLWTLDLTDGSVVDFEPHLGSRVRALSVTPDGSQLIAAHRDGKARRFVLSLPNESDITELAGPVDRVSVVAVTPDERWILLGGDDGVLHRVDARTGLPVYGQEATQLAEVVSDRETAEDALDIAGDVSTIATVLAALSTKPPLSIAILGDWGAGKSSFMRQLQHHVDVLSHFDVRVGGRPAFASNVRQVPFNAWHYSDDHLWVGLIENLFRALAGATRIGELADRLDREQDERARLEADLAAARRPGWFSKLRAAGRGLGLDGGWRLWLGIAVVLAGIALIIFGRGVLTWLGATIGLVTPLVTAWSGLRQYFERTRARKAELDRDIGITSARLKKVAVARPLEELLDEIAHEDRYASLRGLTGRIHDDLRRLSNDLFHKNNSWEGAGQTENPPLQRIILYVDDLDRCPPDRVVEVLQAVNLLLTMDLFMVVVAVDPRWLLKSLRVRHGKQTAAPVVYLDKIFHIPFALRPMGERAADYLRSLLPPEPEPEPEPRPETSAPVPTEVAPAQETPQPAEVTPSPMDIPVARVIANTAEGLRVTAAERDFLARLTPLLGTPRTVKKLANLYRLLRLSVPPDELPDFLEGSYQAAALLLATIAGEPSNTRDLLIALRDGEPAGDIVDTLRATEIGLGTKLADLILEIRKDIPVHTDTATYRKWAAEVARFGFETYDLYQC